MTDNDFLAVRAWIIDRWPTMQSLTSGQWLAYRDELQIFDPSDVWTGLHRYFEAGHDFAPGVSTLRNLCQEAALEGTQRKALPAAQGICWAEYSQQRWGRFIHLAEVARQIAEGSMSA